jgi:histone-lysine N-methyltransferase SETD2
MEYVGEVLDYQLFKKRSKQYSKAGQQHFYFMAINPEEIVDATVKGNISRFINHSCDPNCETQKVCLFVIPCVNMFIMLLHESF